MCLGGSKTPAPPPALPEAARLPEQPGSTSPEGGAGADRRRRAVASAATGSRGTILTGSRGVTQSGTTANKTLLGE